MPSISHLPSFLTSKKYLSHNNSNKKSNIKNEIDSGNLTNAYEVIKKIIDEKQIDFIIEKIFKPSFCEKSNKFKIELFANLLVDEKKKQTFNILYNSKKDTIRLNNFQFKLMNNEKSTLKNFVPKRELSTRTGNKYTGIGSNLNRRYIDNKNTFNLKLGSIFKKELPTETKKIKSLFNDEKLSNEEKERIKVLTSNIIISKNNYFFFILF